MRSIVLCTLQRTLSARSPPGPTGSFVKPEFRELKIFDLIILSRDWHPSDHISFCKNHPGRELFSTIQIQTFDPNENPTKYSQTLWTRIKIEYITRAGPTNGLRRTRS